MKKSIIFVLATLLVVIIGSSVGYAENDSWQNSLTLEEGTPASFTLPTKDSVKWFKIPVEEIGGLHELFFLKNQNDYFYRELYRGTDLTKKISPNDSFIPEVKEDYYIKVFLGDSHDVLDSQVNIIYQVDAWKNATELTEDQSIQILLESEIPRLWYKIPVEKANNIHDFYFEASNTLTEDLYIDLQLFSEGDFKNSLELYDNSFMPLEAKAYYLKINLDRFDNSEAMVSYLKMFYIVDDGMETAQTLVKDQKVNVSFESLDKIGWFDKPIWYSFNTTKPYEPIQLNFSGGSMGMAGPVLVSHFGGSFTYSIFNKDDLKIIYSNEINYSQSLNYELKDPGTYYIRLMPNKFDDTSVEFHYTDFQNDSHNKENYKWENAVEMSANTEVEFVNSVVLSETYVSQYVQRYHWFKFTTHSFSEEVNIKVNTDQPYDYDIFSGYELEHGVTNYDSPYPFFFDAEIVNDKLVYPTASSSEYLNYEGDYEYGAAHIYLLDSPGVYYVRFAMGYDQIAAKISTSIGYSEIKSSISEYLYDVPDMGADIVFNLQGIAQIKDLQQAIDFIVNQSEELTLDQKKSPTGVDLMTLLAETVSAKISNKTISNNTITINQDDVTALTEMAKTSAVALESVLMSNGITPARDLNTSITFKAPKNNKTSVVFENNLIANDVNQMIIETPEYAMTVPTDVIGTTDTSGELVVTIEEALPTVGMLSVMGHEVAGLSNIIISDAGVGKAYKVTFNKPISGTIKLSLPAVNGRPHFQAVLDSDGFATGGKYNPVTGMIDVRIKGDGTYIVKENIKDFSDIANKSNEMQEAIKVLSSKGIINGTSPSEFSPDQTITRAQIAQLLTKTLSMYNAGVNGGFSDVKSNNWYYGAAGSAKKHGVMYGTSETTFAPNVNIPKDQILVVSSRVLKTQMKYKAPANIETHLSKYADRNVLQNWSLSDLALATKEGLVVYRTDGKLVPADEMTRGDAAIILYRLFSKIW